MNTRLLLPATLLLMALACLACSRPPARDNAAKAATGNQPGNAPASQPEAEKAITPEAESESEAALKRFRPRLLEIAAEYRGYTKMADDPQYAPTMCRAPIRDKPLASAADSGAHKRKLYYLWVSKAQNYEYVGKDYSDIDKTAPQPVGQILVKESYHTVDGPDGQPDPGRKLGAKSDLFVMFKLDPATQGTDLGWVYGTLSPDGKVVTAAGKLAPCMKCHTDGTQDRMFGMAYGGGSTTNH